MSEKAAQQILAALDGVGGTACSVSQGVKIEGGVVRQGIGFEVGPQILDGIEFGGVRRQVFQMCRTRQDTFVDELALVSLEAIPDEPDRRAPLTLQMLADIHGALRVDVGIGLQAKVQRNSIASGQDAQRGDGRDLLVAASALCILPRRDRVALYFRLQPDANINTQRAMDFLEHLQRQLRTPIVLVWDSFQAHKGELINECVLPRSAHLEYLPPYAPELNPVEYLWAYLKTNPLANDPAFDLHTLAHRTRRAAYSVQRRQDLLRGFLRHTSLPLRLI